MACEIIRVGRVMTLGSPCRIQKENFDRLQSASICMSPSRSKSGLSLILAQGMSPKKSKTHSDRPVPAATLATDYMIDEKSTDECNNLPSLVDSLLIDGISPMRRQNPMYVMAAHERIAHMSKRIWSNRLASVFMKYCHIATSMAEFYHPEAKLDQFVATSIIYAVVFMIDDVFDHPTAEGLEACGLNRGALKHSWEYLRSLDELLRQSEPPVHRSPLERMMWEVGQEMQQNSTPRFLNLFVDALLEHHWTHFTSRSDFAKARASVHDLDSFTEFRVRDSGGLFTVIIVEFANDEFLPDEIPWIEEQVREHPFTVEMTTLAIKHALLTNDIFSYSKELYESDSPSNVMTVLMERERLTLAQAAWRAIEIVNACHREFVEGERRLREESGWEPNNRTALLRYLASVRDMYSGNIYWSSLTTRYRMADAIFPELRDIPNPHHALQPAPGPLLIRM